MHVTHILAAFGWIEAPHKQHKIFGWVSLPPVADVTISARPAANDDEVVADMGTDAASMPSGSAIVPESILFGAGRGGAGKAHTSRPINAIPLHVPIITAVSDPAPASNSCTHRVSHRRVPSKLSAAPTKKSTMSQKRGSSALRESTAKAVPLSRAAAPAVPARRGAATSATAAPLFVPQTLDDDDDDADQSSDAEDEDLDVDDAALDAAMARIARRSSKGGDGDSSRSSSAHAQAGDDDDDDDDDYDDDDEEDESSIEEDDEDSDSDGDAELEFDGEEEEEGDDDDDDEEDAADVEEEGDDDDDEEEDGDESGLLPSISARTVLCRCSSVVAIRCTVCGRVWRPVLPSV
jgi:hypothetical protein